MIKLNKKRIAVLLSFAVMASSAVLAIKPSANGALTTNNTYTGETPKYVFLFIGDGMSYPQIGSAEAYQGKQLYKNDKVGTQKLNFSNFPVVGSASTFDASSICPDSASTATSISTGNKTLSGVINMDTTKTTKFKTITEMVKEKGKKVGIVTSVSIDHATPAAFYAHQPSRSNYYDIAMELANSQFDYFGGGGFLEPKGKKGDQPDVIETAKKNGFNVVTNKNDILALNNQSGRVIATNSSLDSSKALPYEIDRSSEDLSLSDFTKKGIDVLDNPNGFFMMVEGGKIDWACHANDAASSIQDTLALQGAVQQAINFYNQHPKETLILTTADHETGGLTIGFAATGYSTYLDKIGNQVRSYDEFDNKVIKAYRSYITKDTARLEDLLPYIKAYFGLIVSADEDAKNRPEMVLTDYEVQRLRDALALSITPAKERKLNEAEQVMYGTYEPLSVTLTHILNNKAGIGWTSYSHTGLPVPVFAMGAGQELFNGYYDNTDIFKKLSSIMKAQ
jgi:Alkaline phosphatase